MVIKVKTQRTKNNAEGFVEDINGIGNANVGEHKFFGNSKGIS